MDILIKNIGNLSKECNECLRTYIAMNDGDENLIGSLRVDCKTGSVDCPLVALPPHGRLVSAEDFIDSFEDIINECRRQLSEKGEDITVLNYFHDTIVELMGYMPTVLEANNG